jgi:hypothetical protein
MLALAAVGIGASVGLVIARVLNRPPAVEEPVAEPEPNRLTNRQLEDLLAPYEHAA